MSLLEPRPPSDRASAVMILALVALILAGSTALLLTADNPLFERKATLLLVTGDGVETGTAVILRESGGEAVVRVPRGLSGSPGLLLLVEPGDGEARVYAASWEGAPLGLPWLAKLSLAGSTQLPEGDWGECQYSVESLDYVSNTVRLVAAELDAGPGLDAVTAILYTGEARAVGSAVVTVNGLPVPIDVEKAAGLGGLALELPGGLRGARQAPTSLVVEARLVVGEVVLSGGDCKLAIGVAVLQPMAAERINGVADPAEAVWPFGIDRCESDTVAQDDVGRPVYTETYRDPVEAFVIPVELGGKKLNTGMNLALENVRIEVTVKPLQQGRVTVCNITDPGGAKLPLVRAFQS